MHQAEKQHKRATLAKIGIFEAYFYVLAIWETCHFFL